MTVNADDHINLLEIVESLEAIAGRVWQLSNMETSSDEDDQKTCKPPTVPSSGGKIDCLRLHSFTQKFCIWKRPDLWSPPQPVKTGECSYWFDTLETDLSHWFLRVHVQCVIFGNKAVLLYLVLFSNGSFVEKSNYNDYTLCNEGACVISGLDCLLGTSQYMPKSRHKVIYAFKWAPECVYSSWEMIPQPCSSQ